MEPTCTPRKTMAVAPRKRCRSSLQATLRRRPNRFVLIASPSRTLADSSISVAIPLARAVAQTTVFVLMHRIVGDGPVGELRAGWECRVDDRSSRAARRGRGHTQGTLS